MPVESTEMCVCVCFKKTHIPSSASCKDYSANQCMASTEHWEAGALPAASWWRGTSHLSERHLKVAVMVRPIPTPELWGGYLQSVQE